MRRDCTSTGTDRKALPRIPRRNGETPRTYYFNVSEEYRQHNCAIKPLYLAGVSVHVHNRLWQTWLLLHVQAYGN